MTWKFFGILIVLITLTAAFAEAARVDRREGRQRARIHEGVRSGQLTPGEASHLRKEQRGVRRMERRAKADGVVTPREKARLERAQDKASADIYKEKHDGETRSGNPPPAAPADAAPAPAQ